MEFLENIFESSIFPAINFTKEKVITLGHWIFNNTEKTVALLATVTASAAILSKAGNPISKISHSLNKNRSKKLISKSVTNSNHKYFGDFIDAYHAAFSEEERVSTTRMIEWTNGEHLSPGILYENRVIYKASAIVAFCNCIASKSNKTIYIGHFGITPRTDRFQDSREIYKLCFNIITSTLKSWKYIVFEIDDPNSANSNKERSLRQARIRRFESQFKLAGQNMRFINIDYWHPTFESDKSKKRWGSSKLAIVCRNKKKKRINKSELNEILKFLYLGVYKHCNGQTTNTELHFSKEVNAILKSFNSSTPENIDLL